MLHVLDSSEITLNTSADEIAVCNLGSVNLARHMKDGALDEEKIKQTVSTAIRMLDNVININYYSVDTAKNSNLKHRPIGLGMMGFQDALYEQDIAYCSDEAVDFAMSMDTELVWGSIQTYVWGVRVWMQSQ